MSSIICMVWIFPAYVTHMLMLLMMQFGSIARSHAISLGLPLASSVAMVTRKLKWITWPHELLILAAKGSRNIDSSSVRFYCMSTNESSTLRANSSSRFQWLNSDHGGFNVPVPGPWSHGFQKQSRMFHINVWSLQCTDERDNTSLCCHWSWWSSLLIIILTYVKLCSWLLFPIEFTNCNW